MTRIIDYFNGVYIRIVRNVSIKSGQGISLGALLLFVISIPISSYASTRILIGVVLLSLFLRTNGKKRRNFWALAWDSLLYLIILCFGLIYSVNIHTGLNLIETSLSLLALPVVIGGVQPFGRDELEKIFYAFSTGLLVTVFICLGHAAYSYSMEGNINVFFFENFTSTIDLHPTYMAYYLIAAITFGLYILYYEKLAAPLWIVIVFLSFLFLMLMLTGGMASYVSMLFILSFFILKYILDEKSKIRSLTFVVVIMMIICMFGFNAYVGDEDSMSKTNDYWERSVLWEAALSANSNVVIGVGTGDYNLALNEYYASHNLDKYAASNYNAHNQFIETYLTNGLIGLLSLILLVGRPLYLSVRYSNVLGTLIFFPFIIYGITEVYLGRYQGVVFFALMHQAFVAHYQSYKPSFSLKEA